MTNMVKILIDDAKLMKDLAKIIDDAYKFWGETTLTN
jgi:hypothetical protein